MAINYQDFIHPSDKKAMAALKAVPGFDLITKKLMSIIGEKMFQIETTSSYLKLGPNQLPEIYDILLKVCKKLEIPVPSLYLALDRTPNAYTTGDTDVFVVINSGLLETMTLEQVETIIAHECGHILCHHVLYRSMGSIILNGASLLANGLISTALITSLQYAFFYWMRCSEFSADRVSAYYHGSAEPVVDVMMALAGGTKNLPYNINREEFLSQAKDYKHLIDGSTYNKVLEFIQFGQIDHPLNAYRAYEITEFYKNFNDKLSLTDSSAKTDTKPITKTRTNKNRTQYNLTVKYEFVKPSSILKIGGAFNNKPLEVNFDNKQYFIEKDCTKTIKLESGDHKLNASNTVKEVNYSFTLTCDTTLVVTWDSNDKTLTVKEI